MAALLAKADALEERLHNPRAQIVYDILSQPGGARLYSRLAPLYDWALDGDGAPTQGMREMHAELEGELDRLLGEWKGIVDDDVSALNAKAREAGIGLVTAGRAQP
jgi:hypothetical protein